MTFSYTTSSQTVNPTASMANLTEELAHLLNPTPVFKDPEDPEDGILLLILAKLVVVYIRLIVHIALKYSWMSHVFVTYSGVS